MSHREPLQLRSDLCLHLWHHSGHRFSAPTCWPFLLFAKHKSFHKNRLDVLLLSMALADFLMLLLIPFTVHSAVSFSWPLGITSARSISFCWLSPWPPARTRCAPYLWFVPWSSPTPTRPPTMDLVVLMFTLVWALSFFISLPLRIFATKESLGPGVSNCTVCLPTTQEHHYQVVLSQFVLYYLIPMLVIAVNSARIALFCTRDPLCPSPAPGTHDGHLSWCSLSAGTFLLVLAARVCSRAVRVFGTLPARGARGDVSFHLHGFSSICIPAWTCPLRSAVQTLQAQERTGWSNAIGNESHRRSLAWWRVSEHPEYLESFRTCWM